MLVSSGRHALSSTQGAEGRLTHAWESKWVSRGKTVQFWAYTRLRVKELSWGLENGGNLVKSSANKPWGGDFPRSHQIWLTSKTVFTSFPRRQPLQNNHSMDSRADCFFSVLITSEKLSPSTHWAMVFIFGQLDSRSLLIRESGQDLNAERWMVCPPVYTVQCLDRMNYDYFKSGTEDRAHPSHKDEGQWGQRINKG